MITHLQDRMVRLPEPQARVVTRGDEQGRVAVHVEVGRAAAELKLPFTDASSVELFADGLRAGLQLRGQS